MYMYLCAVVGSTEKRSNIEQYTLFSVHVHTYIVRSHTNDAIGSYTCTQLHVYTVHIYTCTLYMYFVHAFSSVL